MQDVLLAPEATIAAPRAADRVSTLVVRRSEWVVLAFLVYAATAGCFLPVGPAVRERVLVVNAAVSVAYYFLIRGDSRRPRLALSVIRDWLPLALILLAYREMGWFALPHQGHPLESHWVVWDRLFLRGGGKLLIESLGPVVPSILEISYALVYALAPFSLVVLYLYGRREPADRFLLIFSLGVLMCYAQFPFWPSDPPRVVFFGEDFPAYDTIFRRLNWWMLGNYGIHTSVFPSAHVAGAFAAAFGMRRALPEHKWVHRVLVVIAALIAAATVYGRYHYLADACAGFVMAAIAVAAAWLTHNISLSPRPAANRPQPLGYDGGVFDALRE
ncbi:MAG: phosphatase PAP2 family protein [Bryobacteraceae bacterium]